MRLSKALLVAAAGLTLAACGGGSATVGQPAPPTAGLTSQSATTTVASKAPTTVTGSVSAKRTATIATTARTTTSTTTQTHKPTPKPTQTGPTACPANSHTVTLTMQDDPTNPTENYKYSSSSLSIACGGAISITNNSSADHTFSPQHGGFKDTDQMSSGDHLSVRMSFRGTYGFFCSDHDWMTGTVHVT